MADHLVLVPGYAARVQRYGPDWLAELSVEAGRPPQKWSDQQGIPEGAGVTFRGLGNKDNWFHFPITTPTILNGTRLKCNLVAVTLQLELSNAFLRSIWVIDRLNPFFKSPGLNVSEDLGNNWVAGRNMFEFPDKEVDGSIGVSVNIFFDQDANVKFTGAGIRLHD